MMFYRRSITTFRAEFKKKDEMGKKEFNKIILSALLAVALLAGCSRDPNDRKQKYLESGNRYFQKQDYRAASIQFRNAIQIDPKYSDAHFQLALADLQLRDWRSDYAELTRTIDLAPDNFKAQIATGRLRLHGQQCEQADHHTVLA